MEQLFKRVLNPKNPKIIAIGKNYVKHVKEMGGDEVPKEPVIFQKPFSSLLFKGSPILLPRHKRVIHHEIELGFMLCKSGRYIPEKGWKSYVGGYFLALDLTDRNLQAHFKKQGFPWDLAKGQDSFMPISDFVPTTKIKDPHNLQLSLSINGKVVQADTTASMYYKIPQLIAYTSQFMTLNEGDLFLTGTPSGIGPLKAGDKILAQILQDNQEVASIKTDVRQEK